MLEHYPHDCRMVCSICKAALPTVKTAIHEGALHEATRQGGKWAFSIKDGETAQEALLRTQTDYAERSWVNGPALDEDGTGAIEPPPPNIVCTRDPDRLRKHCGGVLDPPFSVRSGDSARCNLPHDAEVQFAGFYHPRAGHIMDTFKIYKVPKAKNGQPPSANISRPAPITE
jgi:hypothetical protein